MKIETPAPASTPFVWPLAFASPVAIRGQVKSDFINSLVALHLEHRTALVGTDVESVC